MKKNKKIKHERKPFGTLTQNELETLASHVRVTHQYSGDTGTHNEKLWRSIRDKVERAAVRK